MDSAEEKGIAEEKGPEASPEASPSLRALAVVILGEAMEETDKFSSEAVLADYEHDELVRSRDANPTGSGAHESATNVMSLMNCMDNKHVESALAVKEGDSELEFDFEKPSGPISEAEIPPVSVAGVNKSRYSGAYTWAMNQEMMGLIESGTFTVLPGLPEGEKAINARWVFSLKSNKDGNITGTKARLVAKGFMQREGVNYHQTYAPTPAAASVKMVLAVANQL